MRDLLAALAELRECLKEIPQADERRLSDLKTEILGRKAGALTQMLGRLPKLDPSSKKEVGAAANALKRDFEAAFAARERELKRAAGTVTGLDLTMPGRAGWQGGLHLVTQVVDEICEISASSASRAPWVREAETERYNFFALTPHGSPGPRRPGLVLPERGRPAAHPHVAGADPDARALPAAIRVVIPGQVYRRDPFDASHSPVFQQIEGLAVDRGDNLRGFEGDPGHVRAPVLRHGHAGAVPAVLLPVHRTLGRDGRAVPDLQGRGLPHVQADRLDGNPRLGAGAPRGARELRRGQRAVQRLRLGMGPERIAMSRHGFPTSACCSRATYGSSRSSREGRDDRLAPLARGAARPDARRGATFRTA